MKKVYAVEFVEYTNFSKDTVRSNKTLDYISLGKEPFLIYEDEIEKYKGYGKGIRTLTLVGSIDDKSSYSLPYIIKKIREEIKKFRSDYDKNGSEIERTGWKAYNNCLDLINRYYGEEE